MRIDLLRANELNTSHVMRWREIIEASPGLASPYFCPEFTQAVAHVRQDVFVAVLRSGGEISGFFPFQRGRLGVGVPVGGMLSDCHGIILEEGEAVEPEALLRACGLGYWEFHHLPVEQTAFQPCHATFDTAHYLNLEEGFSGYEAVLKARGSGVLKEYRKKVRRIERECSGFRFETHSPDKRILEQLFAWKSAQYRESNLVDVLGFQWTRQLLAHIHAIQTDSFAGMLSVIFADDKPIAIHMGMRSRHVWHWWFPRHDREFDWFSPGMVLRLQAAERAQGLGIHRIELGLEGDNQHKPRISTGQATLAGGVASVPSIAALARKCAVAADKMMRETPLYHLVRYPGRVVTRLYRRSRFK